jgi:uncharacterized protein
VHRPVILSLRENEKTPTMVTWSGSNSGPPESPVQLPSPPRLMPRKPVVLRTIIVGAVSAAYVGTALVHRVSERLLERVILVFLVVIGTALIVEAFLPQDVPGLLPGALPVRVVAAELFGLGIGLVSSLLGVAGGELISLPTVAVGVLRHRRLGSFTDRTDLTQTVAPMGLGSVVGAVVGAYLLE